MLRRLIALILAVVLGGVALLFSIGGASAEESQCINCHTDLKGLIRLGWEVEKVKPKKKSAEIAGEG